MKFFKKRRLKFERKQEKGDAEEEGRKRIVERVGRDFWRRWNFTVNALHFVNCKKDVCVVELILQWHFDREMHRPFLTCLIWGFFLDLAYANDISDFSVVLLIKQLFSTWLILQLSIYIYIISFHKVINEKFYRVTFSLMVFQELLSKRVLVLHPIDRKC